MSRYLAVARSVTIGVAMAVCVACGGGSDPDKELATVRSWTATAHMAAEERRVGATTATYTSQLRDRALQALDEERQQLAKAARTPDDQARSRPALDSLAQAIRTLQEAAGQ
ncbi:MAG: hypothetical protein ACJ8AD_20080 [Gemmatimonadaceae bacterium]